MNKLWVWIFLAIPAVIICARFFLDAISYGQAIHETGQWSTGILIATLALTPLRNILGEKRWFLALLKHRRALGVASFCYAALHTGIYLERKWGFDLILKEGLQPSLATGWVALFLFALLAITSNDSSVRLLRRRWKSLHRLVYLATGLTFAHWWLATFDPTMGYVFLGVLLAIQLLRLKDQRR